MVKLIDFNNNWKFFYQQEKERLSKILASQEVCEIEHIGATSVVLCKTGGTIDILCTIQDKIEFFTVKNILVKCGYDFIDHLSDINNCLFFVRRNKDKQVVCTIRVVEQASDEHAKYIGFKQYLMASAMNVKKYNEFRATLIDNVAGDSKQYQQIKADYLESIIRDYCQIKK